ncbi:cyclophane-forming radical SAM/SPASM peptide maturase YhhB [Mucilaginibacter ginsenosidivorans]|uniref:FxsB family radical SAM/SPASM domain protein n=1 Tax=Mucilaginibacter ginsenosidivorans TaxID=398053 RepID=A0A5B8UU06_9SPHI|nr:cyclophane-forming radical SAM/SPASM peptide maturase YhhB [Mucilaginibacter ginsenosidivorans]QEC62413.1 FxsB family radical SAM/SPASM domain protein [Mucilaginibacter ginsenosidivorans]
MPELPNNPTARCFLLKVASRCNINCDYCYMYNHLDQGWKSQPKLMSDKILQAVAERIRDYTIEQQLDRIAIVYHGGEPLLMATEKLINHAELLKSFLPGVVVEFSLQTNGVLLKEDDLIHFQKSGIQVSLSLDGPASANNRHRLDHKGKSSYSATEKALSLLENYPEVFSGVIAVIDADNSPLDLLKYFAERDIPQLDFLLPDANYLTLPPGRSKDPERYLRWLIECFDIWFDNYSNLKIRTFDSILASLMGVPSETDGFGFGDVSLITIETDGCYHDLDVLKITGQGTNLSNGDVHSTSIFQALQSEQVNKHRVLLTKEGLSEQCQNCPVVDVCGGGAVAHRYGKDGFLNPSIYCMELKGLIEHANKRVNEQLQIEFERREVGLKEFDTDLINEYETQPGITGAFRTILGSFEQSQTEKFKSVIDHIYKNSLASAINQLYDLSDKDFQSLAIQPSIVAWTEVMQKHMAGITVHDIDRKIIAPEPEYVLQILALSETRSPWPSVQREDRWLRLPFADKIYFEPATIAANGKPILDEALNLINSWKPELIGEMQLFSPEIQFIRDPSAHPDKVVSFSDNSVPGALYVQVMRGNEFIDPSDLADSIIHEHRHQKLYMLQRVCPIVHADYPLVASPWREELRPPTGLFHALFVFVELLDFWTFLKLNADSILKEKADKESLRISEQLSKGFAVVESCDLTEGGRIILTLLNTRFKALINENYTAFTSAPC